MRKRRHAIAAVLLAIALLGVTTPAVAAAGPVSRVSPDATINEAAKTLGKSLPAENNCKEVQEVLKELAAPGEDPRGICSTRVSPDERQRIEPLKKTTTPNSGAADTPQTIPFPQWCWDEGQGSIWRVSDDRHVACRWYTERLDILSSKGDHEGYVIFDQMDLISTPPDGAWFRHQQQLQLLEEEELGEEVTATGGFSCVGWCEYEDAAYPRQDLDENDLVEGARIFGSTVDETPTQYGHINTRLDVTFGVEGVRSWVFEVYGEQVRCDYATYTEPQETEVLSEEGTFAVASTLLPPGCVFSSLIPAFQYYSTEWEELAQHITLAQQSGLPGAPGTEPLHRISGPSSVVKTLKDRNRNRACGKATLPAGKTHSCDEYPMASTYEGGWTKGSVGIRPDDPEPQPEGWQPRSFDSQPCYPGGLPVADFPRFDGRHGEKGVSACVIDADDNSEGGSDLGAWYTTVRILDQEAFYVEVVP